MRARSYTWFQNTHFCSHLVLFLPLRKLPCVQRIDVPCLSALSLNVYCAGVLCLGLYSLFTQ